jgi:hypothetical protein
MQAIPARDGLILPNINHAPSSSQAFCNSGGRGIKFSYLKGAIGRLPHISEAHSAKFSGWF